MGLLYTKMKVFHFKEKIDSLPESVDKILAPIQIRIKPTNVCAHNCWYCAYRAENLQLGKDMVQANFIPKDKMLEIIDDIAAMGVKSVTFSGGGDPFHYPHFLDALKKLSMTKVKFATLTHGARLEGEVAEIFAQKGTWVRVSMDGWDDQSYSKYRRVPREEFSRVLDNMKRFKELKGKCYLGVSVVVDKENAAHLYELIEKLCNYSKVDSVKVSACIVSNIGSENNAYHKPLFEEVKKQLSRAIADFTKKGIEIYDAYHLLDDKFSKEYSWCPYLQIVPVIGADLNVYACHDKAYNFEEGLLGSIKTARFKDFWFSEKDKFFRIKPSLNCNHHCMMNANNKMILDYLNADKGHLEFV